MLKRIFLNEKLILTIIIINSIILFILPFNKMANNIILVSLDTFITLFFISEVVVKMCTLGFRGYFYYKWNIFDFLIITASSPSLLTYFIGLPDISFLLIFRIARLFRFFRFLKFIPNIDNLITSLNRALKASVGIIIGLFIYIVLLGVLSCSLFSGISPEYFRDPIVSVYSIFKVLTIEGWYEIPEAISLGTSSIATLLIKSYFVFIVITGGLIGLSLANAILVDEMTMDNNQDLEKRVINLEKKIDKLINLVEYKFSQKGE